MKKTLVISLLAVLLSACAAPTTVPSVTVPETLTPSSTVPPSEVTVTSIPSVVLTATPSETPPAASESYLNQLNITFESPEQLLKYNGAEISGQTSVDKSAWLLRVTEVTIKPETLAKLSMRALRNIFLPEEEDNDANLKAFAKKLAEVQNGTRDCAEFMRTVSMYDANGSGTAIKMTIVPACGASAVPDGAMEVKDINFITGIGAEWNESEQKYVKKANMPWFEITVLTTPGSGLLFDKKTGTMHIFVGLSNSTHPTKIRVGVAGEFETTLYWLKLHSLNKKLRLSNSQKYEDRGKSWTGDLQVK